MKSIWREIVLSVIMGMILPGIVLNWAVEEQGNAPPGEEMQSLPLQPEATVPAVPKVHLDILLRHGDGTVETMDMDTYLVGVVLAEMPSTFEQEAKKAQAVVARTFARKAFVTGGKHGDGSVCTDSACCQAYISAADYLGRGGTQNAVEAAQAAVEATSGYVLTYEGGLIEATYFSCSGGSTEDAVAVWGTDFPYLRATESPGEEYAAHFTDTVLISRQELEQKLGITLPGGPEGWIGMVSYTAGGGVNTMDIGGKTFSGTKLRSLLNLRSTVFTIDTDSRGATITTRGFGHRVGMSQYGADAMAAAGASYQEILSHYYQGTTLELTKPDS